MRYQLEQRLRQAGAAHLRKRATIFGFAAAIAMSSPAARGASAPEAEFTHWVESQHGQVGRSSDGAIVEVSLARTWATNNDIERVVAIKSVKRLDLSFTYISDPGIERLRELPLLEELNLDTTE